MITDVVCRDQFTRLWIPRFPKQKFGKIFFFLIPDKHIREKLHFSFFCNKIDTFKWFKLKILFN